MAVVASATGAAVFGLSGVAAGLAGGALLGAGAGALYSGITGDGNILNSALTGGLIGGAVGGIGAALAPAAAGTTAAGTSAVSATPALTAAKTGVGGLSGASGAAGSMGAASPLQLSGAVAPQGFAAPVYAKVGANTAAGMSGGQMLGAGLAGTAALSLLGGMNQPKLPNSPVDPGQIRPYTYSSVQNDGQNGTTSVYPTTPTYDKNGLPILDTRERNYFTQSYTAGTPYTAANGGLMAAGGPVERMSQKVMGGASNMYPQSQEQSPAFATASQMPVSAEIIRTGYDAKTDPYTSVMMAEGGETDSDNEEKIRKTIMKNLKHSSVEDLRMAMDAMDEQKFLMKNMPTYAASMAPSISSMVEGAQYGDKMAKSYGGQPRDVNVMPRIQDLNNYGGIASIGRQLDPDTRVNLTADLQRSPYDRNALESVRRVGGGVSRNIGKDSNLSAYYEQDPMGRNKQGGVRYTQNFDQGGITYDPKTQRYSGLPSSNPLPAVEVPQLTSDIVSQLTPQWQAANPNAFAYDPVQQRYSAATPNMSQLNAFKAEQDRIAAEAAAANQMSQGYTSFENSAGGANGGLMQAYALGGNVGQYNLGGYSDGGRLLKGPGDGVSDDIPAVIGNKQPARLADGEFVIPARIVSELGNGSTDAGAKRLYAMMDKIQAGRKKTIGKGNVAKDTKAKKHLLA